jgi:hypothetical protein
MPPVGTARPRGLALVAFAGLGVVGALAYLASGALVLLVLVLTAKPGAESFVLGIKSVVIVGWAAIGIWTILRFWRYRWQFVIGPPCAWAWTYLVALLLQDRAYLNWGY